MRPLDTSVFNPHSPQARAIAHLFYYDLGIAAVIALTVISLVVYAVVRYRRKPGDPEPYQDEGNPKLETLWTVIPAGILFSLAVLTAWTMHLVNPTAGSHPFDAVVIAHQWWWEYRYPQSGVVTANELHMPEGQKWLLRIESADVIHDFWVPDLGSKKDAIPGHPNYLWIQPQKDGVYLGTCAEFCGAQHALMGIRVIVQPEADFAAWEQSQLRIPPPPSGEQALEGRRLFDQRTCGNCHRVAGTAAVGQVGPDLTHVADRQTLGANLLDNTPANLAAWIHDPQKYKPGCHMPDLDLTGPEAEAIAAYLEGLK
jgi:cytochrome c oxidase subunit 2